MWAFLKICLCLLATIMSVQAQSTRNSCENLRDHILVPSDESCSMYFECIENVAYLLSCPRGLYFSESKQSCDLPSNVECDLTSSTTPGPTTPGPTLPPPRCIAIPNFQYIPSPNSCSEYYQCIDGVAYLLSCPRGLYFSESKQSCDLPSNVECDLTSSTTPGPTTPGPTIPPPRCIAIPNFQYIPSPNSCSEYYQCIDGVAYLLSCPRGLYFSDIKQSCDLPTNANCPLVSPTPPGTTSPPPTTPGPSVRCINVDNLRFIPSPSSCSLYYQCIDNVPYLVACPRGLYFSELIQTCDLPSNVVCDIITTPQPPPPPQPNCEDLPDNTFLPSPNSCSFYYQCIGNVPYLVACPRGLYFNELIQTCDLPSNVNCVTSTEVPTSPTPPTAPTVDTPNMCDGAEDGTLMASQTYCERYYICFAEFPVSQQCIGGLHFNPATQRCEDPEVVNCSLETMTTTVPSTTTEMGSGGFCDNVANTTFVRNPIACGEFFQCINNEPHGRQCDGRSWFNFVQQRCTEPSETYCVLSPTLCNGVDDDQRVRSVSSCSDFIICSEGEPYPGFCNARQWFDEIRQVCDEIENVECDLEDFTESPSTSECFGVRDFLLTRSRDSCTEHFVCVSNEIRQRLNCADGQWFDTELQACNDASNVICVI